MPFEKLESVKKSKPKSSKPPRSPVEPVSMPFEKPKSVEKSKPKSSKPRRSPDSLSSKPGRTLTKPAKAFWKAYLSDGRELSIEFDDVFLENKYRAVERLLVRDDKALSPQQERALEDWNAIARLHDKREFPLTSEASARTSLPTFATYKEREIYNKRDHIIEPAPSNGGELGLTNLFDRSVCSLANEFVNNILNFVNHHSLYVRNFTTSLLVGSGTTDLAAIQKTPLAKKQDARPVTRPIIFEHKPYFTLHDLLRLMFAMRSQNVTVSCATGEPSVQHREGIRLSKPTNELLLQIVEQMHVTRARYCVLGTWDYYLVFFLNSRSLLGCSNIVCRDPADIDTFAEIKYLRNKSGLNSKELTKIPDSLKPSSLSLLQVLVALMVERLPETSQPDLWCDGDAVAEIYRECLERSRQAQGLDGAIVDVDPSDLDGDTSFDQTAADSDSMSRPRSQYTPAVRSSGEPDRMDTRDDNQGAEESNVQVDGEIIPKRVVPILFKATASVPNERRNYPVPSSDHPWLEEYHGTWPAPSSIAMQPDSLSVSSSSLVPDPISDRTDGKPGCESERPVIEIVLSAYVSSGHCYDAYRGSAKVRYPSSKTTVEVPIIAKYIDYDIPRRKNSSDTGSAWHIYGDDDRIDRYEIEIEVLEDLRRTDIAPHLYAAYKGGQASEKRWLVMEDCGVRADLSNPEVQYAVRNAYAVAHASGILHEDVAERHVLSRGGRTKIIDWEGSTRLDWKNRQEDFDEEAEDEIMRMERMLYNYDNPSESEGDTR